MIRGEGPAPADQEQAERDRQERIAQLEERLRTEEPRGESRQRPEPAALLHEPDSSSPRPSEQEEAPPGEDLAQLGSTLDALEREAASRGSVEPGSDLHGELQAMRAELEEWDRALLKEIMSSRRERDGELAKVDAERRAQLQQEADEDAEALQALIDSGYIRGEAEAAIERARLERSPFPTRRLKDELRADYREREAPTQEERRVVGRLRMRVLRLLRGT